MTKKIAAHLNSLLPGLARTMQRAGTAIMKVYRTQFQVDYKPDTSPLTMADQRAHEIIFQDLAGLSDIGEDGPLPVLSEEGRDVPYAERSRWEYYWLVDPLDGTKEFVKRNGEFTVNIALICGNRPDLGFVYLPVTDVLYWGIRGIGAYRLEDLQKIDPAGILDPENRQILEGPGSHATGGRLRVIGSRSHSSPEFEVYLEKLRVEYGKIELVLAGSSLKFCRIAEGSADIYPRFGPTMEWDTAAGHAVAVGSGKEVVDQETEEELLYNKEDLRNGFFICR